MLSILIPIYNRDITDLVARLKKQCDTLGIEYEILCFDDCSRPKIIERNRALDAKFRVNYVEFKENMGRAKIRNTLARVSRYDHLLFLDCDSGILKRDFIKTYIKGLTDYPDAIINGGRNYAPSAPKTSSKILHWKYGITYESKEAVIRQQHPIRYFHSNNFVITRDTMLDYPFDETLDGYGYEDLVLATQLYRAGKHIVHIDNNTRHLELVKNKSFLKKIDESLDNLIKFKKQDKIIEIPLLVYADKIQHWRISNLVLKMDKHLLQKSIIKNLLSDQPNIKYLQWYKLAIVLGKLKKAEKTSDINK